MYHRFLLPVDLTDKHQQALEATACLARLGAGDVTLLHVIEVIPGLSMEEEKAFYQRLERAARRRLDELGAYFQQRAVPWRAEVRYGHRGPDVAQYAKEMDADLIVLTAPRFDPERPAAGWGSLSYKIGLLSACPVLLVK